ncbi:AfsR/SARP family transcriptional regulator [Actinoplanes sp. TFC3]|uniref:AfsR/SARP family transcriptional regulator n=1 Tax=Actinoplanes sp. TFC3 TaxID=1710355 RepID=UPI00137B1CD3|nr:AfsR/SARP family transcriptional regulator [Actinoplanes sp. TFC3]
MILSCAQAAPIAIAPKPRKVLALLALHADQVVPTASLMRELWAELQPRTAMTTLQTYVGQLRRSLSVALDLPVAAVTDGVLITEDGGYCLSTSAFGVDYRRYTTLDLQGRMAMRAGDARRGAELLSDALAVWRGQALVNVQAGPLLQAQVNRLEENRLCTTEHRIIADLRLGEHHSLVSELVELTLLHPLHEALHGHLMLALYRCQRRSEALAVFRGLRARLVAELGIEPSANLAELERFILNDDPRLDTDRAGDALCRLKAS